MSPRFGIHQSQLSGAWCLIYPNKRLPTEWFDTWAETVERFKEVVRTDPQSP